MPHGPIELEVAFEILEETPEGLRICATVGTGPTAQTDEYFMPYPEKDRIADMKEVV